MQLIFNIYKDPNDRFKILIAIYNDKEPYDAKTEIKIDLRVSYATAAVDRRSDQDQKNNMYAIFGLSDHDKSNKLVRVQMSKDGSITHSLSDEKFTNILLLLKCFIVSDYRLITFRLHVT